MGFYEIISYSETSFTILTIITIKAKLLKKDSKPANFSKLTLSHLKDNFCLLTSILIFSLFNIKTANINNITLTIIFVIAIPLLLGNS